MIWKKRLHRSLEDEPLSLSIGVNRKSRGLNSGPDRIADPRQDHVEEAGGYSAYTSNRQDDSLVLVQQKDYIVGDLAGALDHWSGAVNEATGLNDGGLHGFLIDWLRSPA